MAICTGCGIELGPSGRFCPECGTPRRPPECPACGAPSSGGKFCAECGTALNATAPAPPPPAPVDAPVAERRLTSILFGDLVGFTPLSESRDAEDVRELLSRYFERARTIVGRYGGTVEKFIGDAVMAVWGVPVAREDDAERSVRAGLDLAAMVAELGEEVGADLALRVGITTGEVAVTLGAVAEGMVAGDAVNTAARVQTAAAPGTVWVDELTRDLTAAAIAFEDMGEHELKGKAEPVRLHHARSVVASVGGSRRAGGLEPPFTGRERQLRLVKELLHETVDEGRPRFVLVSGPAGVGKTRLAWELEKYIDGLSYVFAWHRGRCLSYGDGSAFGALAEVVRLRLGLEDGDPLERSAERLADLMPDAEERAWVAPRLEVLLGTGERSGFDQDDLFAAWTRFLERAGQGSAVIVVLEDLHFATSALLDFIDHLLATAGHAIYVVGLARPELLERRPELLTNRRVSALHLEPLQDDAMRALLDGVVEGLTGDIRTTLLERAEGIPLYAVETVRSLLDRGVVVGEQGSYRLADGQVDLTAIGAPASLHALVAGRLDALPGPERRLVALASVLGISFTREALDALVATGDDLGEAVAGLVRRDVLNVQTDRFSADRGHLRFVQSVVRQVAYETLSRRDRRAAHLAAAGFLEGDDPTGELSPTIAQHLLDAVAAGADDDVDVDDLRGRAVELLLAASERALATGAADAALRHLRVAEENAHDPDQRLGVREIFVQAALQAGDVDACIEQAEKILPALDERDPERSAVVAAALGAACNSSDRMAAGIEVMKPRLAALGEDAVSEGALSVLNELSRAHFFLGDLEGAAPYAERHLDVAERLGDVGAVAVGLITVGTSWGTRNRPWSGAVLLRGSVDFARRAGQPGLLVRALVNCAAFDLCHDLPAALAASGEAMEMASRASAAHRMNVYLNRAAGLFVAGAWDELRELLSSPARAQLKLYDTTLPTIEMWLAEAAGEEPGQPDQDALTAMDLVLRVWGAQQHLTVARVSGDRKVLADVSRQSGALMREYLGFGDDFPVLWPLTVLSMIAAGALDEAASEVDRLAAVQPGALSVLLRAQLVRVQGLLAAARGEDPESLLREAITALDDFGAVPDAARTRHALAEWLIGRGRADEAAPLVAAARATYEQLGAHAWLAELPAVTAQVAPAPDAVVQPLAESA